MRVAVWVVLGGLLAGCAAEPLARPDTPVPPARWEEGLGGGAAPDANWFEGFGSPALDELIREAQRNSADLAAAEARVRQADARMRAAGGALLPAVNAVANVTRISGSSGGDSARETDRALQFAASYEIDFWGAARAGRTAAREQRRAAAAESDVLRLSLEASIAETYISILELRAQQQGLNRQVELLTGGLAGLEAREAAGLVSAVEVSLYRSTLSAAKVAVASLRQQQIESSAALALLVGRSAPVTLAAEPVLGALSVPAAAGVTPSEVLARRPDIAAAEAALAEADANVTIARAALLPRLSLDAVLARQNPGFQAALTTLPGSGTTLSAGATLMQAIFDGGIAKARRAEAMARREELIAGYRKSISEALVDVQRALQIEQEARRQHETALQAENVARTTAQALAARIAAGLGDPLSAVEAERAQLAAQDEANRTLALRLRAAVGLFRALGGGWKSEAMQ